MNELLKTLSNYNDNPLNIVEPPRTVADSVQSLLNERSQLTTVETMVRETNIERFISEQDPQIYWHAADYSHRSRRCKAADQQKCKGSRLVVEFDGPSGVNTDILVKNTLR